MNASYTRRIQMIGFKDSVLAMSLAMSFQACSGGALTTIVIRNAPKSSDAIIVATDGRGIVTPLLGNAKADANGNAIVTFALPASTNSRREIESSSASGETQLRFRAIALQHHGSSIYPFVIALAACKGDAAISMVVLDFAAAPLPTAKVGTPVDLADGTLAVPVTLSGGAEFFTEGQVIDVWISHAQNSPVASGALFAGSLTRGIAPGAFNASLTVPAQVTAGRYQVGFYANQFREDAQIPLLMMSITGSQVATPQTSSNATPPPASPVFGSTKPGTYAVAVGKDGKLVRKLQ
jgi:hypothetical protein